MSDTRPDPRPPGLDQLLGHVAAAIAAEEPAAPRCACPSRDAGRCAAIRYPAPYDDEDDDWGDKPEPCTCACHDEEPDDDGDPNADLWCDRCSPGRCDCPTPGEPASADDDLEPVDDEPEPSDGSPCGFTLDNPAADAMELTASGLCVGWADPDHRIADTLHAVRFTGDPTAKD